MKATSKPLRNKELAVCHTQLNPQNVSYVQALANYSLVHMADGRKILTAVTLKKIQERLLPFENFIRINRSIVLNTSLVPFTDQGFILGKNKIATVARRRRNELSKYALHLN